MHVQVRIRGGERVLREGGGEGRGRGERGGGRIRGEEGVLREGGSGERGFRFRFIENVVKSNLEY